MASFVEQAVLMVKDQSTGPINKVNRALQVNGIRHTAKPRLLRCLPWLAQGQADSTITQRGRSHLSTQFRG